MSPPMRNGPPGQGPAAAQIADLDKAQIHGQPSRATGVVTAVGELHRPGGRRHLWALLVRRCGYLHIHRTGQPGAGSWMRTGSCGADYTVRVIATTPVQITPAGFLTEVYQLLVCDLVDAVAINRAVTAWVDDEGGPVLFTGGADQNGATTSLSPADSARIAAVWVLGGGL